MRNGEYFKTATSNPNIPRVEGLEISGKAEITRKPKRAAVVAHFGVRLDTKLPSRYETRELAELCQFNRVAQEALGGVTYHDGSEAPYAICVDPGEKDRKARLIFAVAVEAAKPSELPTPTEVYKRLGLESRIDTAVKAVFAELERAEGEKDRQQHQREAAHLLNWLFTEARKVGNEAVAERRQALDEEARRESLKAIPDLLAKVVNASTFDSASRALAVEYLDALTERGLAEPGPFGQPLQGEDLR